jgi:CRP/FNR family transcriptional regulator, cyclic AMP receptor protein
MPGTTFDVDVIAAGEGRATYLPDGAAIFSRGDPGECAYIVTKGRVRIDNGNGVPIETVGVGEIVGEMALLDNEPHTAAAVAVGPTEILSIDRPLFEVLIRDDPDFALTILRLMVRRLRATMTELDHGASARAPAPLRALA